VPFSLIVVVHVACALAHAAVAPVSVSAFQDQALTSELFTVPPFDQFGVKVADMLTGPDVGFTVSFRSAA
jgi:hypothetical protein